MKKHLVRLVFLSAVAAVCVFGVACGAAENTSSHNSHEHSWSDSWAKDDTNHWRVCTVSGCTEIGATAAHDYTSGNCVCGKQKPDGGNGSTTGGNDPTTGGNGSNTGGNNPSTGGNGSTTVTTSSVTAEKWKELFDALETGMTNYTYTGDVFDDGHSGYCIDKYDGNKCYNKQSYNKQDAYEYYHAKDGDKYYSYTKNSVGNWTKAEDPAARDWFNNDVGSQLKLYFADNFSLFTYANGKYTCASISKNLGQMTITLSDMEITFANNAIYTIKLITTDSYNTDYISHDEFKDIGTTIVTLPLVTRQ